MFIVFICWCQEAAVSHFEKKKSLQKLHVIDEDLKDSVTGHRECKIKDMVVIMYNVYLIISQENSTNHKYLKKIKFDDAITSYLPLWKSV